MQTALSLPPLVAAGFDSVPWGCTVFDWANLKKGFTFPLGARSARDRLPAVAAPPD